MISHGILFAKLPHGCEQRIYIFYDISLFSRRHQQHYHSQRRENPRERQERPVSNFYEYESVQAAMHSQQNPGGSGNQAQGNQPIMNQGGQPNYAANTIALQQQSKRLQNNNGVTLPSPTVPLGLRQISPSQFQAVPMGHQHPPSRVMLNEDRGRNSGNVDTVGSHLQIQQRRSQQNSLPRRQQKGKSSTSPNCPKVWSG
jgi:hypothetical protein